ncbi:MAG: Crp/Fnr family transcriptional regulator [Paracoccus sp. (in: a-proteobacteria)]
MAVDISILQNMPLFHYMRPKDLTELLAHAHLHRVTKGKTVFEQGDKATTFYLLLHGRLKVTQVTPEGQQVMMRIIHPGDLFGFARALARSDYPATSYAAVESLVIGWPMADWDAVVAKNPYLAINAMQTIGEHLDEAHTRLREMSTEEVERRVAHVVLRLMEKAGTTDEHGTRIDFPITRQDIAEMTGTTLYTVSRLLSSWESQGLIEGGRQKLTVRDAAAIAHIADPSN